MNKIVINLATHSKCHKPVCLCKVDHLNGTVYSRNVIGPSVSAGRAGWLRVEISNPRIGLRVTTLILSGAFPEQLTMIFWTTVLYVCCCCRSTLLDLYCIYSKY